MSATCSDCQVTHIQALDSDVLEHEIGLCPKHAQVDALMEALMLAERALRIPTLHPEFDDRARKALDAIRALAAVRSGKEKA